MVVPLLLGAPKYLSGEMSLGQLMQIAAAFVQVQLAFNWLVENYAAALDEVLRLKPSAAKGKYLRKVGLSSSMGPGLKIDVAQVQGG